MTQLYLRDLKLIVAPLVGDGLDLSEFHFKFIVKRGDSQSPNSIEIRIYNLSDDTAHRLQNRPNSEFSRVILQAGYQGLVGTIFDGNIKYVNLGHESAVDSYADIVAADGDSAYNFAVVNITLAAGSSPNDHINACLDPMKKVFPSISDGYIPTYEGSLPRGKTMFGMSRDYLRPISNTIKASWGIQDGKLQMIPVNGSLPDEAIVLDSNSGMIGFPQKTISGLYIRSLLNPAIKIGSLIKIDNASVQQYNYSLNPANFGGESLLAVTSLKTDADGLYRVLWSEHSGDTRGNYWFTDIICVSKDVSITAEAAKKSVVASDEIVTIPSEDAIQQ